MKWLIGNKSVGRGVKSLSFSTSHSALWWPDSQDDFEYSEINNGASTAESAHAVVRGEPQIHRVLDSRVYILGIGNIGKLVAHSLAGIPNPPPITLLFHRSGLLQDWKAQGEELDLVTQGISLKRKGFQTELAIPLDHVGSVTREQSSAIQNLVVAVKGPRTVAALSTIAHRLDRESTIVFLQNGMGILDEINDKIFPSLESRPNYMLGIISHGLHEVSTFKSIHAGIGTTALGLVPRYDSHDHHTTGNPRRSHPGLPASSRYLLRTLTRTPALAAVGFHPTDLLQLQIEKLAVNAIINPLTVMFDCKNGDLRYNFAITRVMRLLLSEISFVIRSLPELQDVPNLRVRFSPERLEQLVIGIAEKTALNDSSMLQDVRLGKNTEIDYINGYIVRRGEALGIRCVMNYMLLQMVKGKSQMTDKKVHSLLPIR